MPGGGTAAEPADVGASASTPADNAAIQTAASRLFKGLADGDVSVVAQNTATQYIRKLNPDKLRVSATGPKLKAAFNGNVTVVRTDKKGAVVEAQIFTPDSSDVPTAEVSRVRIYLIKQGGDWKAAMADKKDADNDADINGGWYHSGFFTFCPNKGLVFTPNHFSREMQCETVAQCARF